MQVLITMILDIQLENVKPIILVCRFNIVMTLRQTEKKLKNANIICIYKNIAFIENSLCKNNALTRNK